MTWNSPTTLGPSAHVDTFCRDHLPPTDAWPELLFELAETRYGDRVNCGVELLTKVIAEHGAERFCLLTPAGEAWTYGDLEATANRIANVLTGQLGLVPGNRVLLRGPNNPWLAACWLGVVKAGAVTVSTMPLLRASELATIGEIAQPTLALCDHRFTWDLTTGLPDLAVVPYGGDEPD